MQQLTPNPGKNGVIEVGGVGYLRLPVKTHVITDADHIADVAEHYVKPHLIPGDLVFISEKSVSCSQRRAIPLKDIHPRPLARLLTRFVYKSPYGIGLGIPETMEMALQECGTGRILLAAGVSAFGKLIGRRGWFYQIAGYRAESIDGPTPYTLPPYNECVVLGPENPDQVAGDISLRLGCPVAIVDANDLNSKVLGASDRSVDRALLCKALKDNPLGQSSQQTPMGILRRAD